MTKNKKAISGHGSTCKPCHNALQHSRYDYDRIREQVLVRKYGMTMADYHAMVAAQGGVCAICGEPPPTRRQGKSKKPVTIFHVDHDHATTRVRALLCLHCNTGIGYMRENAELARRMIAYLEKHIIHPTPYQPSRDPHTRRVKYVRAVRKSA